MRIHRVFTADGASGFDGVVFGPRDCRIQEEGEDVFSARGLIFPETWSQSACDLAAQKYFRKAGNGFDGEKDIRQVIARIVGSWRVWGERLGYFSSKGDAQAFFDEMCFLIVRQMASPNSPQWFNTGLFESYGIEAAPQGHFYIDEKTGNAVPSKNAYERPQVHACFIQSVSDDLVNPMGIMDLWVREARVFKFGSGTGTNFSSLRGAGEVLEGGGISSGVMAFLRVGDVAAGSVRSGGITRRAAKMVCLDLDHPEIEEFISWKAEEERKVGELVAGSTLVRKKLSAIEARAAKGGYELHEWRAELEECRKLGVPLALAEQIRDLGLQKLSFFAQVPYTTEWRGEAYRSVFGQNANTSVRVPNAFLEAVKKGQNWKLRARKDARGVGNAEVSAEALWNRCALAAWASADPGVQYETLITEWHTCPQSGPIRASNPCSEYLFLDDTGCNLASLNLLKFWDFEKNIFESEKFSHACRLWTLALDISVSMAQYPSEQIAKRSLSFRTLGLGFANLGSLLMATGRPYDSDAGRSLAAGIASLMAASSWLASAELAAELESFAEYAKNQTDVLRVLRNHARAAGALSDAFEGLSVAPRKSFMELCPQPLMQLARTTWRHAIALAEKNGVRNAQLTAIAPTGTIGLVMDCDTTGIEPEFSLVKRKTLAGGGSLLSINRTVPLALNSLGYEPAVIAQIETHFAKQGSLDGAPGLKTEHLTVFACAQGLDRISVEGHLGMVAAVQPFISGGISKTVSLDHKATVREVRQALELAHSWMIKCVSIFRDGSKLSQPLTAGPEACFECG